MADKDGHHLGVQSYLGSRKGKYLSEGISKSTKTKECCRIKLALELAVQTCWKQSLENPQICQTGACSAGQIKKITSELISRLRNDQPG